MFDHSAFRPIANPWDNNYSDYLREKRDRDADTARRENEARSREMERYTEQYIKTKRWDEEQDAKKKKTIPTAPTAPTAPPSAPPPTPTPKPATPVPARSVVKTDEEEAREKRVQVIIAEAIAKAKAEREAKEKEAKYLTCVIEDEKHKQMEQILETEDLQTVITDMETAVNRFKLKHIPTEIQELPIVQEAKEACRQVISQIIASRQQKMQENIHLSDPTDG